MWLCLDHLVVFAVSRCEPLKRHIYRHTRTSVARKLGICVPKEEDGQFPVEQQHSTISPEAGARQLLFQAVEELFEEKQLVRFSSY